MNRLKDKWEGLVAFMLASLLMAAATWRVMSYATGQDVRIYFHWAGRFLESHFAPSEILACTKQFVPGFPLLLAVVQKGVGYFAACWINLPLLCAAFAAAALCLRRISRPREIGLALLLFLALTFHAAPLNLHFLLLPFRNAVEWLFMFSGLALILPALDAAVPIRHRMCRAFLTGLWLTFGALFRETITFLFIPLGVVCLWQGLRGDRNAWKTLGTLILPPLCVALAAACTMAILAPAGHGILNKQAALWWRYATDGERGALGWIPDMLSALRHGLTWPGVALLVLALVAAIRRRAHAIGILATLAVLLLLFYSRYKTLHPRYLLSFAGLFFLLAGWGAALCLSFCVRRLRPALQSLLFVLAIAATAAWTALPIARATPWGQRVTRSEIRALQRHPVAAAPVIYVDGGRRIMVEALLSFTAVRPVDSVTDGTNAFADASRALYLAPLNDIGLWAPSSRGVRQHDWIAAHYTLIPEGPPLNFSGAAFQPQRLLPPDRTLHTFTLRAPPSPGVLWLTLGADLPATLHATVSSSGVPLFDASFSPTSSFLPLWIPATDAPTHATATDRDLTLQLTGDRPFLCPAPPRFVPAGTPLNIPLEDARSPAILSWLNAFEPTARWSKHGACIKSNALLNLPIPYQAGTPSQPLALTADFHFLAAPDSAPGAGTVECAALPPPAAWTLPGGGHPVTVRLAGPLPPSVDALPCRLTAQPAANSRYLRLQTLSLTFAPLSE